MRVARVGRVARLLRVALGGRSSVLGLGVSLLRRRSTSVRRLVVGLLGVGRVGWRVGVPRLVVVVGVVAAREGGVGLVGEGHGGGRLYRVGQRSRSSSVRVG